MTRRRQLCLGSLLVAALAGGLLLHSGLSRRDAAAAMPADGLVLLPEPAAVAAFQLETHRGEQFQARDLAGHWTYLFFGFTNCPHICPTTVALMAEAEEQIRALPKGEAFRGLFISVDPERDDAAGIAAFLGRFSERFLGLRGARSEIKKIARDLNVAFAKMPDGQGGLTVEHSSHIVLIDPEGRYRGVIKRPRKAEALVSAFRRLVA